MRIIILTFLLTFLALAVKAQDPHFSQFSNLCFHDNPAGAGFSESRYRFSANTKIQWSSVSLPYQTYLASFDFALMRRPSRLDMFGMGVEVMRDQAGDAQFGTTGLGLSLAYIKALNNFNNHFLSIGASFSLNQRSFDLNPLTFDNQFNGLYFDPSLPGGESFIDLNFWYPTIGAGLKYFNKFDSRHEFTAGLSMLNINRPPQSHFDNADVRLKTRWMGTLSYRIDVANSRELIPEAYVSMQGVYREILIGAHYRLIKDYSSVSYNAVSGGIFWRTGDAFVFVAQMDYLRYKFGLSYDVNISGLVPASNLRGGFELSFIMKFDHPERRKPKEIPCPIF
ncbi:MAG: PorP/SprF family type IX secretion system membrane protein [Bacteroidales bacterium]|nr:PorP/SprF family type IX secretion system membrane protein [Bacteroidales bacterium]